MAAEMLFVRVECGGRVRACVYSMVSGGVLGWDAREVVAVLYVGRMDGTSRCSQGRKGLLLS